MPERTVASVEHEPNGLTVVGDSLVMRPTSMIDLPDIRPIVDAVEGMRDIVDVTPLEELGFATDMTGVRVVTKREDLTEVGSFKIRGSYNKMRQIPESEKSLGVVARSAGNAAQGTALAGWLLGVPADIYMPLTAPQSKVDATRGWGAEVIQIGDNYSETNDLANELLAGDPRPDIPAYDDEDVINGQATVGYEILEQCSDVTTIFVPGGGGGFGAGVAKAVKALRPDVKVIIVEPDDSNAIQRGYIAGKPVPLEQPPSIFADGVAVRQVGDVTLPHILRHVDGVMTVSKAEIIKAISGFVNEKKRILEPAGALSIAGAIKYASLKNPKDEVFATIASGSGVSPGKIGHILVRGEELMGQEALFSIRIPEKPGSLRHFFESVVDGHNITELTYARDDEAEASILVGFSMKSDRDKERFVAKMTANEYGFVDRSADEDFKAYERRVVRGSAEPVPELSYVISMPERSGALVDFLEALGDRWDISRFLYKTHHSETGDVYIAFATTARSQLEERLKRAGYSYRPVDRNSDHASAQKA